MLAMTAVIDDYMFKMYF